MAEKDSDAVTPPEGKTTIDDRMFFEPERLGYASAASIADRIAAEIGRAVKDQVVVIAGAQLLADLTNLQAVHLRLESLRQEYAALSWLTEGVVARWRALDEGLGAVPVQPGAELSLAAGLNPVGAALQAAIGLVSLLREDVEYRGAKTEVDALAFEIALADGLKARQAKSVFIPDLMVMNTAEGGGGSLRERLSRVQEARTNAWKIIGPLVAGLVRLEAELDIATSEKDQARVDSLAAQISELRRDMEPVSDPLSRADRALAELQTQWNQVDAAHVTMLARLLRAEVIRAKNPLYVHARVVSSGGHHRVSRNLFRMLFLGDGLSFAGGATVRWALLGADGAVEMGGIMVERRRTSSLFGTERVAQYGGGAQRQSTSGFYGHGRHDTSPPGAEIIDRVEDGA